MKSALNILAWSFAVTALVYCGVGMGGGVLYDNPLACLGVGMIGIGLCMEGRRKLMGAQAAHESAQ
jgi:VIT1/CCC1 family predicted Fe2+/Mn2+ transporter